MTVVPHCSTRALLRCVAIVRFFLLVSIILLLFRTNSTRRMGAGTAKWLSPSMETLKCCQNWPVSETCPANSRNLTQSLSRVQLCPYLFSETQGAQTGFGYGTRSLLQIIITSLSNDMMSKMRERQALEESRHLHKRRSGASDIHPRHNVSVPIFILKL